MSQFLDYTQPSTVYDSTRIPVGLELILGCLATSKTPLPQQHILECGCGTGNYLVALRQFLASMVGIDFSEGMLAQARSKLPSEMELVQGDITKMNFGDNRFDGVVCNQVLHHLDGGPAADQDPAEWVNGDFPRVRAFLRESHRVIRPGGKLVLSFCSHQQCRDGFWWSPLIPNAVSRLLCRLPDTEQLQRLFGEAGYRVETVVSDLLGVLQGDAYLNPRAALEQSWRDGDSTWDLVSPPELESALQSIRMKLEEDEMESYLAGCEASRRRVGQSTFICGVKE